MATKKASTSKKSEGAVSPERLRAFWAERQYLAGAMKGKGAAEVLERTGWLRSVGGCNPYLALRDRAGLSRASVDAAVAKVEIHELPSARGCTYVVPKGDYAVALRASQGHGDDATMAMATKFLGVTKKEIDRLCDRVLALVAKAPLDPAAMKESLGDAVRSLGPEGKKRGTTSTLPIALGFLQTRGLVRRVSTDGRLDQQRYRYVAWSPSPLATASSREARLGPHQGKTFTDEELAIELARRFFRWTGPATVNELAWWGGLGVKAARAAALELEVVPLEDGDDRLLFADDRDALLALKLPREPRISFVSSLDNLMHLRRAASQHVGASDLARIPGLSKKEAGGALADLPYHAIVDRGRVIGLWDWDGVSGKLGFRTFAKSADIDKRVAKEGEALSAYVTAELGDVRSFSLDSPASRAKKLEDLARARW